MTYVSANQEVRRLTRLIANSINDCRTAKAKESGKDTEYAITDCCLPDYYQQVAATSHTYGIDPDYPLLECDFCIEADRLIQERKKARAKLGAAKRQITVLGKMLIKKRDEA